MSERYWPGPALATTTALVAAALSLLGAVAVTGSAGTGPSAAVGPSSYTARQLAGALLPEVGGARPAAAIEAGTYGALPDVQTSRQTMQGVTVTPARCAGAAAAGFSAASFLAAPAAIATFRVGRDGVSEVLVAATSQLAARALSAGWPAGCAHYQATVDGKTFSYSVREAAVRGVADQARALNLQATGYAEVNVWSAVYRGGGFVGTVTMVGPDVSELGVTQLAEDAYACARRALPRV